MFLENMYLNLYNPPEKHTLDYQYSFIFYIILFIFLINTTLLTAEEQEVKGFDLKNSYFSFTPKLLKEGTQSDYLFGLYYSDKETFGGEGRLRTIKTTAIGKIWDISDSMTASENEIYEIFLLPFNFQIVKVDNLRLRAGVGAYYNYNKSGAEGYFNDSSLYDPAGPDKYNMYAYDFLGNAIGALLDLDVSFRWRFLYFSFSGGIVPVFYFHQETSLKLSPFMTPPSFSVTGGSASGPYYYLNLDIGINFFDYVTLYLSFFNEFSRLTYKSIDIDQKGAWAAADTIEEYNTFALEISLLINLNVGGLMPFIGYGRTFNEDNSGEDYFMLGVKKFIN